MPRATANVTVHRPTSHSVSLSASVCQRLCNAFGMRSLPDGFQQRLEDAINLFWQYTRRRPPSEKQAALAFEAIEQHAQALYHLLGQPGDAIDGPLAHLCRCLPGGLNQLRQTQNSIEEMTHAARRARSVPAKHDLAMSPHSAKVSMAIRIAELLDDYGIAPMLTTEPKPSIYLQVVKVALGHVGGGDMREIPAEGLRVWREYVQRAMAGP